MTERPILFSGEMVRAILDGRKTQTRRVCKIQPKGSNYLRESHYHGDGPGYGPFVESSYYGNVLNAHVECPYGQPGDRLWCKESYYQQGHWEPVDGPKRRTQTGRQRWKFIPLNDEIRFDEPETFRKGRHKEDPETVAWHRRSSLFMRQRYSRITLEVKAVRVERLQWIRAHEAIAEGIWYQPFPGYREENGRTSFPTPVAAFHALWDSINTKHRWDSNPWVWVVEFDRL